MKWYRYIKNDSGATSILVIFMMIVLVTLGAFSITNARVNIRFAQKAMDWETMYYELDSLGERYLQAVDAALAKAEAAAVHYGLSQGYLLEQFNGVPTELQQRVYNEIQSYYTQVNRVNFSNHILHPVVNEVYVFYANEFLTELQDRFPEHRVFMSGTDGQSLTCTAAFTASEVENTGLTVSVDVLPFSYSVGDSGAFSATRTEGAPRYEIKSWHEWQENEAPTFEDELWDGIIIEENIFERTEVDIFGN